MGHISSTLPSHRAHYGNFAMILLAIILLIMAAWLAIADLRRAEENAKLSDDVHEIRLYAGTLLSALADAETGQRGFLLTGDRQYLDIYDSGRARLKTDFEALEAAPLSSPERIRQIRHIRDLSKEKMAELAETLALYKSGNGPAAIARVRENIGKQAMDAVRVEVDNLQAEAKTRLSEVQARGGALTMWSMESGLVALATMLLTCVWLRQQTVRAEALVHLALLERFAQTLQGMMRGWDGRITFWSAGIERLYGYTAAEALGKISHDLLKTEFPQPLPEMEKELLRDGQWHGDLVHRHRNGTRIYVTTDWMLQSDAGKLIAVIEIVNDRTPLKKAVAELREGALKLQLAVDASNLGIWRWDISSSQEIECDKRCRVMFGFAADLQVVIATFEGGMVAEDRVANQAVLNRSINPVDPHDEYISEYRFIHPDGTRRWFAAYGRAEFETDSATPAGRRVIRILGTVRDISEEKSAGQEKQRADALLRTILEATRGLIYAKDTQGKMLLANQTKLDLIRKPWPEVVGRTAIELYDDKELALTAMVNEQRLMEEDRTQLGEERLGYRDAFHRVWFVTKAPFHDEKGAVIGLAVVSVDITELKHSQEKQLLLINELNHRVKNTLATVQAIALKTLNGADAAYSETFQGRLFALASVHDVLARKLWNGVELENVVEEVLAPHGGKNDSRILISGPKLRINSRAAQAIALGLHELATNALKYGALGAACGQVIVLWEINDEAMPRLRLSWRERGGPIVELPTRRGFGTQLVERALARDLGGSACIKFDDPGGVYCVIEAPLDEVSTPLETGQFPNLGETVKDALWH